MCLFVFSTLYYLYVQIDNNSKAFIKIVCQNNCAPKTLRIETTMCEHDDCSERQLFGIQFSWDLLKNSPVKGSLLEAELRSTKEYPSFLVHHA